MTTETETLWRELMAICEAAATHDDRLRVAKNEADTTADFDAEAQEHLKIDGARVGRDFRLYGFIGEIGGEAGAVADFTDVLMAMKHETPNAFAAVRGKVDGLDRYFPEEMRARWRELWD